MSLFNHPFMCVLSGIAANADELEESEGGLPEEWVKLTLETRYINPKWEAIQSVKQGLLQQTLSQVPEADQETQLVNIAIQVEAQYAQLEAVTEKFSIEKEEIYISPPERDPTILSEVNKLRQIVGLAPIEVEEQEEDDEATSQAAPSPEESKRPPEEPQTVAAQ